MIVSVPLQRYPYDVHVGPGLLDQAGSLAADAVGPVRCALISDSNVAPLYEERVSQSLCGAGFQVTTLVSAAGEKSKCLVEAASLCEQMISAGLDRSSAVFALGGGVVGDLAGFVAAIYLSTSRFKYEENPSVTVSSDNKSTLSSGLTFVSTLPLKNTSIRKFEFEPTIPSEFSNENSIFCLSTPVTISTFLEIVTVLGVGIICVGVVEKILPPTNPPTEAGATCTAVLLALTEATIEEECITGKVKFMPGIMLPDTIRSPFGFPITPVTTPCNILLF